MSKFELLKSYYDLLEKLAKAMAESGNSTLKMAAFDINAAQLKIVLELQRILPELMP